MPSIRLKGAVPITRHLDGGVATRRSQLAGTLAIPAIARIAPFWGMARGAQMRRQFSFQHLFKRVGKQAGEDTFLAKEVIDAFGTRQLLLNALNRWQDG